MKGSWHRVNVNSPHFLLEYYQYVEEILGKLLSKDNTVSTNKPIFALFLKKMHIEKSKENLDGMSETIKYIKKCMVWPPNITCEAL
jgi:hypothetical protein